jgi:hypothetical protein
VLLPNKCLLFIFLYRLSPETFGYTLVCDKSFEIPQCRVIKTSINYISAALSRFSRSRWPFRKILDTTSYVKFFVQYLRSGSKVDFVSVRHTTYKCLVLETL